MKQDELFPDPLQPWQGGKPNDAWKRVRREDPSTSHAAANRAMKSKADNQAAVFLVMLQHGPMTDGQLVDVYPTTDWQHQSPSGLRTRRCELVERGLVRDTGEKAVYGRHQPSIVWEALNADSFSPSDPPV